MSPADQNDFELTSHDEAMLTAMSIAARRRARPEDLPSRPKIISRLPVGGGDRELRVCVYKHKNQARVDIRYWNATGTRDSYRPEGTGLNFAASQIVILQEALRRAAKNLEGA